MRSSLLPLTLSLVVFASCDAPLRLGARVDGAVDESVDATADAADEEDMLDAAPACEAECSSGVCSDGVCCENACDGFCFTQTFRAMSAGGGFETIGAELFDLDADGFDDAVFFSQLSASGVVYWGNADGELRTGTPLMTSRAGGLSAAGDLDEDGFTDLAFAIQRSGPPTANFVRVLFGGAGRTFPRTADIEQSGNPSWVALLDADRDGHLDLFARLQETPCTTMRRGRGDGGFGPGSCVLDYSTFGAHEPIRRADVDGDGRDELVELRDGDAFVRVHSFGVGGEVVASEARSLGAGAGFASFDVVDLGRDGKADLVAIPGGDAPTWRVAARRAGSDAVCEASSDLRATDAFGTESIHGAGDFNGDGLLDFVGATTCGLCSSTHYLHLGRLP